MAFRDLDLNKINFIVPELIKYLKENGSIDDESLRYFPERYPFNYDDFIVNFSFLQWLSKRNKKEILLYDYWPTERCYLNIAGEKIIVSTICGQGCAEIINHYNDLEDKTIYKEEFEVVKSFEELVFDWPDYIRYEIENKMMEDLFNTPQAKRIMKELVDDLNRKKK